MLEILNRDEKYNLYKRSHQLFIYNNTLKGRKPLLINSYLILKMIPTLLEIL